jgi:urease accessory protein
MSALLETSPTAWHAKLLLEFARRGERTVLARRAHSGPLVVQRPFYPEGDVCHVYVVHPPGGIVGGDQLHLTARVEQGAHAVITTPAATKFYRASPEQRAHLQQELHVAGATLEWLPQETIHFRDAYANTKTVIRLTEQSRFIGWELNCYGRPASGEKFASGHVQQHFELWVDEQPVLLDHLSINGSADIMQAKYGLADKTTLGTLVAYPATADNLQAARTHQEFACTLVDKALTCRLLTQDSDTAKQAFVKLWQTLRPHIIGREAVLPRIWAT